VELVIVAAKSGVFEFDSANGGILSVAVLQAERRNLARIVTRANRLRRRDFPATIPAPRKSGAAMPSHDLVPYFFFSGTLALMAVIITVSILYAKKRTRELTAVAQQIGFRFVGKNWSGLSLSSEPKVSLLQRTRGRFSNVMSGSSGGLQISLFDYTYPMGKSSVTQTLAAFSQDQQLPPFALRPENVFDRIGDAVFHNDINFDSNPEFSKRYLLRSPDEANTLRLFTPSLLTYLEQFQTKWYIEGAGPTLIVYRGGRPVSPFDMPAFLEETSRIARTFFASDGLRKPVV
jgi:hypothetical protein